MQKNTRLNHGPLTVLYLMPSYLSGLRISTSPLENDACNHSFGAVRSQERFGQLRQLGFNSELTLQGAKCSRCQCRRRRSIVRQANRIRSGLSKGPRRLSEQSSRCCKYLSGCALFPCKVQDFRTRKKGCLHLTIFTVQLQRIHFDTLRHSLHLRISASQSSFKHEKIVHVEWPTKCCSTGLMDVPA